MNQIAWICTGAGGCEPLLDTASIILLLSMVLYIVVFIIMLAWNASYRASAKNEKQQAKPNWKKVAELDDKALATRRMIMGMIILVGILGLYLLVRGPA